MRALKRRHRLLLALAGLLLLAGLALRIGLRPENVAHLVLQRAGAALGLEIRAGGRPEYRLLGTPRLVLREVTAREPGAPTPVLRAERIAIAVPWATLRARGAVLNVQRIELDAPVLDLPALQAWLARRPAAETRIPTVERGLSVVRGRLRGDGWEVDRIELALPRLHAEAPVAAAVAGRYLDPPMRIGVELQVALTRPALPAGAAAVGRVDVDGGRWRLPARIRLSGALQAASSTGQALRIAPARLAMSARYESGATRQPFALGVHGPVRFDGATWTLAPAGLGLRGEGVLPDVDARGAIALGRRLALRLQGSLPDWNAAWPALPPPLGQSTAPLPFRLEYVGAPDFGGIADLHLQRERSRFDARFRLPQLLAWAEAARTGSPLPPLDGRVTTPRLDVSGAQLHGVEVEIDDPGIEGRPAGLP